MKIIKAYSFKSKRLDDGKANFLVFEHDNGIVMIRKRFFTDSPRPDLNPLRKGKNYTLYEENMALKLSTFHFIFKSITETMIENDIKEIL